MFVLFDSFIFLSILICQLIQITPPTSFQTHLIPFLPKLRVLTVRKSLLPAFLFFFNSFLNSFLLSFLLHFLLSLLGFSLQFAFLIRFQIENSFHYSLKINLDNNPNLTDISVRLATRFLKKSTHEHFLFLFDFFFLEISSSYFVSLNFFLSFRLTLIITQSPVIPRLSLHIAFCCIHPITI